MERSYWAVRNRQSVTSSTPYPSTWLCWSRLSGNAHPTSRGRYSESSMREHLCNCRVIFCYTYEGEAEKELTFDWLRGEKVIRHKLDTLRGILRKFINH